MSSVSLGIARVLGRASAYSCFTYLVLAISTPGAYADLVQDAVNRISLDRYRMHEVVMENMGLGYYGGPAYNQHYRDRGGWAYGGTLGNQEARLYLINQFTALGLTVSVQSVYQNVVGEWPGVEMPERILILCAHYDTTSDGERPGGDDDASGVAGLLEAARVLTQCHFRSTLRFIAFNSEENWEKGSQAYVDALPWNAEIAGVINLDMILRPGWDSDPQQPIDLELETRQSTSCTNWVEAFMWAAAAHVPALVIDPNTHYPRDWDCGDQGAFLTAGYPTLTAVENTAEEMWAEESNLYYHTSQDASDAQANDPHGPSGVTYDYDFAVNVVKAAVATLATQAGLVSPDDSHLGEPQATSAGGVTH